MILPEAVRVAVMEWNPKNSEEASKLARSYIQARSRSIAHKGPGTGPKASAPNGHWARDCPNPRYTGGQGAGACTTVTGESSQRRNQFCTGSGDNRPPFSVQNVKCNERGHYSSSCPKRSLYCEQARQGIPGHDKAYWHETVNWVYCPD